MVYLNKWELFTQASHHLVNQSTTPTRYTIKFDASKNSLILKVTNDSTCLKFKTKSSNYLNRFETLTKELMKLYCNLQPIPIIPVVVPTTTILEGVEVIGGKGGDKMEGIVSTASVTGGGGGGGGNEGTGEEVKGKKKKSKKKK